jgi:uncharacterized heparinase superfamily protein
MTILRTNDDTRPEIWCRCDGGPHGFLSIAAHAHADALSVEVRHDGVEILADPGTYCYHGQPEWRAYFRSTLAHNTLEVSGRNQSQSGGPFMWTRHARTTVLTSDPGRGGVATWTAEHDGYTRGREPAEHRRTVRLDRRIGELEIHDEVRSPIAHDCRLAFHLGPRMTAVLDGDTALLSWDDRTAVLELPRDLAWTVHHGQEEPPLGWYSESFGLRQPATTLVGTGRAGGGVSAPLVTLLRFPC